MPHNPTETHCPKCDVQLVFTSFEGETIGSCPHCNYCEAEDPLEVTTTRERSMTTYTANKVLTREEAAEYQLEKGYHPSGYGFYGFKVEDGKTSWSRGNSCD